MANYPLRDAARHLPSSLTMRGESPYRVSKKLPNLFYKQVHRESGEVCGSIYVADLKAFFEPKEVDVSQIPNGNGPEHLVEDSTPALPRYNQQRRQR